MDSYSWSMLWLPDVSSSRRWTWEKGEPDGKEFRLLLCFPTLCARKNETWLRDRYRVWAESDIVWCLSLCDSKTHSQSAHRLFGFLCLYRVGRCWEQERIQNRKRDKISEDVLYRGLWILACIHRGLRDLDKRPSADCGQDSLGCGRLGLSVMRTRSDNCCRREKHVYLLFGRPSLEKFFIHV